MMRVRKILSVIIMVMVFLMSTNVMAQTPSESKKVVANALISRNVPAYALHNQGDASRANDDNYGTEWKSYAQKTPTWLAYDLSKVSAEQRGKVIVVWYNNSWGYDRAAYSGVSTYSVPSDYTIEVNSASGGGSAPLNGWVSKVTVTGNYCHSRQHLIDMSGYNWIRINVLKTVGDDLDTSLQMDVHDGTNGANDDWLFLGDSITAGGITTQPIEGTGTFSQLINSSSPSNYPIQECGGIGGWLAGYPLEKEDDGRSHLDRWISQFPGLYVTYNFGTNDAGWAVHSEDFYKSIKEAADIITAAGKIMVIPKIPWARSSGVQNNAPRLNLVIDQIYTEYPGKVIPGPDLWNFFLNNQNLISDDNLHPSTKGYAAMRREWANFISKSLYNGNIITQTPTVTVKTTPISTITPTPTATSATTPTPTKIAISPTNNVQMGNRIYISGSEFYKGQNRIWINGANTPWNSWNDFGGSFDEAWWSNHFQQLRDNGMNSTRVWITCSGEVGINIDANGYVSGATSKHWADLDKLFLIAQSKGIYLKATLISYDHFKNTYTTYDRWRKWLNSDANIDSYINNYLVPFVNRYKSNPYLWCIDFINEPDWVYENAECGQFPWDRLQTYFAKAAVAVHANSNILTTVDTCMNKYVSNTVSGSKGNMLSDAALMAKVGGDIKGKIDFYTIHQYDWQTEYWGNSLYMAPSAYGLGKDKPAIIGECPSKGSKGHTITEDYESAYKNGWQGVMAWTSNSVDTNGGLSDLGPATKTFMNNHTQLVYPPDISPTPTSSPSWSKLSGYVMPDISANSDNLSALREGFKISLDGKSSNVATDKNGYFEIDKIPAGTSHYISISKQSYLTRLVKNISLEKDTAISTNDTPILMWAGDVTIDGIQDNVVNMVDVIEIAKVFNTSSGDLIYREELDFNKDKAINISDIIIMAKHFGESSSDYGELKTK